MEVLRRNEYLWAVNSVSMDDGHNVTDSVWSSKEKAENRARKIPDSRVVQTSLWQSEPDGKWYDVSTRRVIVDPLDRAAVLAKLTEQEREALGL